MFLMKICIVASGSDDEQRDERDDMDEMLLERIMTVLTGEQQGQRRASGEVKRTRECW
jgi:hypothetical protein